MNFVEYILKYTFVMVLRNKKLFGLNINVQFFTTKSLLSRIIS